ncbi:hypothetical protein [uncultured Psychrobacter sp.]|uniref:hypothetical protein n=1 Tax=uncultured Psychrobacter sp. TaxID=259303 RepID=UPI002627E0F1|nr:hypothetical protein [uncultured Psychrobacter sp.]
MTQFGELTILYFQISAALMMGWDYFIPKDWRNNTDGFLNKYFSYVHSNVDKDFKQALESLKLNIFIILLSLAPLVVSYLIFKSHILLNFQFSPFVGFFIMLIFLIFILGGLLVFLSIISPLLLPLGLSGIFKVITKFIISTEKGSFSGLGFLCLLVSFMMKYANYKLV